jgi:FkbM family methyltransferase
MYAFHPDLENDILNLSGNKKDGFFVDIGAHNGIEGSNTKYLEEIGWSGICIEPHPHVFESLKKNRKCESLNCAIWEIDTTVNFMAISGYSEMLSGIIESYDPRHSERIQRELQIYGGSSEIVEVDARRFDSIVKNTTIDFLSIDTEGSEMHILKQVDFSLYDIKLVCIENNFGDSSFLNFFEEKGYKFFKTYLGCDQLYYKNI